MIGRRSYTVAGVGPADPYLRSIRGRFEGKLQDLCRLLLADGDLALDVGANIGATSIILGHHVGSGRVLALEPGPRVFSLLQANIAASGMTNVEPINCAVGASPGRMAFHEDSAYGHLVPGAQGGEVTVRTIDELVESLALPRVDFIKIDTEGFEPHVFAGARRTIERFRPIIYFEFNAWTLLALSQTDPIEFMRTVCALPADQYTIARRRSDLALEPINGDAMAAACRCMVYNGSLLDVLLIPHGSPRAPRIQHLVGRSSGARTAAGQMARAIGRRLFPA